MSELPTHTNYNTGEPCYCDLGWWVISGSALMHALERAAAGENPSLLYTELYANTESRVEDE